MANGSSSNQQQQQQQKAQAVNWLNAPLASQPSGEVLAGTAITGGGTMSGYTPLYDAQTGGFAGWQDPKGGYYQATGGNYGNYNARTGEMYAPPTYPPPQQAQQAQQQQPSLADMWKAYMSQGAQQPQAQAQQPAQSNITPITPYGGQQLAAATPFATIPGTMPTVAPPPAPGAGQQQWQPQQIQRFQQGGPVLPQQQSSASLLQNPANLLYGYGAAATDWPMYINPTPQPQTPGQFNPGKSQGNSFGGGDYTGPLQPTQSTDIPMVPGQQMSWQGVASAAGLSPNDIAEFQKAGFNPNQVAQRFNISTAGNPQLGGPPATIPGIFVKAPSMAPTAGIGPNWASQSSPLTPTTPAFAAQGTQAPTPWATAPPAPGVNLAGIGPRPMGGMPQPMGATAMPPVPPEAHVAGLVNAGKALYGHMTGNDPETATDKQIVEFHRTLADHITQYTAGANPSAASLPGTPPGGGAAPQVPAASAATTALKAHSGGLVPGRGHGDTVPALLTPGEYVLTRKQADQLFGGRTPIKMASGGEVPDDSGDEPPEARRRRLEVAAASAAPQAQSSSASGSESSSWSPPALGGYTGPTAAQIRAQNAAANNRIGSGGPGSLDALGTLGDEPLISSMGIGVGSGPGSGMPTQQAAGVIGGLAAGLNSAMDAYQKSIGSWQMKPQAFGGPASAPTEPVTRFAQNPAQPTTRQPQNPMLSPYYQQYFS